MEKFSQGYTKTSGDDIKDKLEDFCYYAIFFGCIFLLILLPNLK